MAVVSLAFASVFGSSNLLLAPVRSPLVGLKVPAEQRLLNAAKPVKKTGHTFPCCPAVMPPANHPIYHKDEKVFCFHHEILYEAKILEVRLTDPDDRKSPYEYRVHYKGWKNTYVHFLS